MSLTWHTFFILWAAGVSECILITQWPRYIFSHLNNSIELNCYQNDTEYEYLYWYKQQKGGTIQMIASVVAGTADYEDEYKSGYQAARLSKKQWTLTISRIQERDEAFYLCAASVDINYEAYFGQGTKLTVLDPNFKVTPPTVKLLGPSSKENGKHRNGKKTLVCVASKFYPDHVSVSWYFNDVLTNGLVASDHSATWLGESYRITSRLSVSVKDWENPNNRFKCEVSFFNGTATTQHQSETLWGEKNDQSTSVKREKFLKITQTAKLSYCVFIMKSCVYGAFVVFLFWRLQSSREKQNS